MFGKGGEFQPLGVFTDKEVEHVDAKALSNDDLADSNGMITADFPVYVRSKVLAKNVDDSKLGWAFNSVLEGYLMNLKTTTGAYIYRDEMNSGKLAGFHRVSNQITTDSTGLTELAFGNWRGPPVGEQMGLETYTTLDGSWVDEEGTQHNAFEENLAATRALMYVDIAARHKGELPARQEHQGVLIGGGAHRPGPILQQGRNFSYETRTYSECQSDPVHQRGRHQPRGLSSLPFWPSRSALPPAPLRDWP